MAVSPARKAAFTVVTRVRERAAFAHETLDSVLNAAGLDPRDSAFATRLAYGTIASRGTLDEAIARFVDRPAQLEPRVTDALAVSAYEILFARTPARAAVNEGVELVRAAQPRAAGLANAVLRKLSAAAADFPWGDPESDTAALARLYAHPRWMAQLWIDELGRETAEAIMVANNEPAPLFLAHLPFKTELDDVFAELAGRGAEPLPCPLPGCIVAGDSVAALSSRAVKDKAVLVADAGAQMAVHAVRPRPGQTIVELGAGRGTKSIILAGLAYRSGEETAEVIAVDSHGFKLDALRDAVASSGAPEITTVVADATNPDAPGLPEPHSADSVLVDAPCSGLGTLRRHPDRRWRARPEEMESLAAIGMALLTTAARLVKPGGFVVYSTCTIASVENAGLIEAFLRSQAGQGFSVDAFADEIDEQWGGFVTSEGYFQSVPQVGGPDGHFIARLVLKG